MSSYLCSRDVEACRNRQAGYTLLEILLVVTLIAIAVAMVAPSFVHMTGASLDDEARRLQQALRLASEESQLTGSPVRVVLLREGYRFEQLIEVRQPQGTDSAAGEQTWKPMQEMPFDSHQLGEGIEVGEIRFSGNVTPEPDTANPSKTEEHLVGRIHFWPDGMLDTADLVLASPQANEERVLELRSGPGGIRLADKDAS